MTIANVMPRRNEIKERSAIGDLLYLRCESNYNNC